MYKRRLRKFQNKNNIENVIQSYLNLSTVENSHTTKKFWLYKFIQLLPNGKQTYLVELTLDQINSIFRVWIMKYENPNTFNLGRQIVIGFVRWAIEEGFLKLEIRNSNVVARKKPGDSKRIPYSTAELQKFCNTASHLNNKFKLLITLLITIAPRASEIASLRWCDVFIKENYIFFKRKGGKLQAIPICNFLYELFYKYYKELGQPLLETYIFSNSTKEIPTRFEIYYEVKTIAKKAGIKYRGIHLFRHSLALEFDSHNIPSSLFIRNFGWADERMKQTYVQNDNDNILKEFQNLILKNHNFSGGKNDVKKI